MPSGPASLLSTSALGARSKAALGRLLARLPKLDPAEHATTSVDDWIAGQDFRPDADAVLRALIRIGTYSPSFDDLRAGAAIAQLQRASKAGVIYVDGGWRQLTDALAAQVTEVRRGANVAAITDDGEVRLTDGTTITAGAIVLAAGPPSACRSLLPTTPDWGDLGEPVTAAALDVAVRGVPSPGYVLGVDDPVYGTTQSPPADQAPKGDSVVSVLRYGATHAADDRAQLEGWLAHVGVRPEAIVHDRFLARMTVVGAQPRAVNGGLAGRPPITATGMAKVFLAGDWVGPDGMLADAALASGHAAGLAACGAATTTQATMVS
jgi:phytoene dehydrogenase-like protein